jgi:hypothetical protein
MQQIPTPIDDRSTREWDDGAESIKSSASTLVEDNMSLANGRPFSCGNTRLAVTRVMEEESGDTLKNKEYKDLETQSKPSSEQRLWSSIRFRFFTIYRRLFLFVFVVNMAIFIFAMCQERKVVSFMNVAATNLLVGGLARQPLVINAIFRVVCSIPRSAPLILRRISANAYHYGGIHSGCGIAGFFWYLGAVGLMTREHIIAPPQGAGDVYAIVSIGLAYSILSLLLLIIVVAYPSFRVKRHDSFELIHRFSSWAVLVLFLVLLLVFSKGEVIRQNQLGYDQLTLGNYVIHLVSFWLLIVNIIALIHPWLLLRKVEVRPEYLSSHAVRLHFNHTTTRFALGIQLAIHPLRDWHSFATFPDSDGGFSCLVSKAGDWTAACIANQPTKIWKRGVLLNDFAYGLRAYRRLLVVTTGSGIGPCLSFLGDEDRPPLRVVWQTRSPLETYGQGVLDLVEKMDPHAMVIDTDKTGRRLDMLSLILRLVREDDIEAVCIISNRKLGTKLVYQLETRGILAYSPIFDS